MCARATIRGWPPLLEGLEDADAFELDARLRRALDPPTGNWDEGSDEAVAGGTAAEAADASPGGADAQARDSQTGAQPTPFPKTLAFFFTAPRDVARVFRGALATVQRRIEHKNGRTASESEALDAILEHAFETWGLANAELQREHRVFERDGWRCTGRTGSSASSWASRAGREPLARYRSGDVLMS